jgi:hypothetical protein
VDKDLRASLVAAGSAAALSALIGLFAGVGFGTLIFRALLCAILIGVAVYGGILLLRNLLPGILTEGDDVEDFDALSGGDEKGANIDIVLPGEAASSASFAGPEEITRYAAEGRSGGGFDRTGPGGGRPDLDETATELTPVDETSLLDPDDGEGRGAAAIPINPGYDRALRPSAGFEDLDVLPDLEGFSDAFTASEFSSGGSSDAVGPMNPMKGGSQGLSGSKAGPEGLDPASLAQAVRTILKRDQKG